MTNRLFRNGMRLSPCIAIVERDGYFYRFLDKNERPNYLHQAIFYAMLNILKFGQF